MGRSQQLAASRIALSWMQSSLAPHLDLAKVPTFRANDIEAPADPRVLPAAFFLL
jgi:hypothetical protein